KLVSIKLGTLLSSQTTTTPNQHIRTIKQSVTISAGATFQPYPHEFVYVKSLISTEFKLSFEHAPLGLFSRPRGLV
ncbi:hypothetical protein, partial [Arthrobacter psychrochitiniphilus]|uniref:hypothetical protein n=1 Tax=Arthrobacter psychrochitiniphilus TaxID=291045 RepID=UPI003F7BD68D